MVVVLICVVVWAIDWGCHWLVKGLSGKGREVGWRSWRCLGRRWLTGYWGMELFLLELEFGRSMDFEGFVEVCRRFQVLERDYMS